MAPLGETHCITILTGLYSVYIVPMAAKQPSAGFNDFASVKFMHDFSDSFSIPSNHEKDKSTFSIS